MEVKNSLKNENMKITYLNLIILILIISSVVNALVLHVFKLELIIGYIFVLLSFVLGGVLVVLILDKNRILSGVLVSAVAATVSFSIYAVMNQIIAGASSEIGQLIFIIFLIPVFLIAGALMGLIGSIIVVTVEKLVNRD